MQQNYTKIITHAGTHHADEILAIATVFEFAGEIPVERKNKAGADELDNPAVLVLDLGSRLEPEIGNFDHHQDGNIPATNILLLNHFCNDENLKAMLFRQLFASVDATDRGIFHARPPLDYLVPDFNSIIRSLNNVPDGFDKALQMARQILAAEIAKAVKSIKSEEIWKSLEKHDGIAIQRTTELIVDWREFAERDGILLYLTPNREPGKYQITSRDSNILAIPETPGQQFRHPSGFLAVYPNFEQALSRATEIANAYKYPLVIS